MDIGELLIYLLVAAGAWKITQQFGKAKRSLTESGVVDAILKNAKK